MMKNLDGTKIVLTKVFYNFSMSDPLLECLTQSSIVDYEGVGHIVDDILSLIFAQQCMTSNLSLLTAG